MLKQGLVMLTRLVAFAGVLLTPIGAFAQTETVYYVHTDAIGSVRSITNQDQEEVARHDFLPFGEEWAATSFATITSNVKFAGLERDPETGLDYAMARYYRPQSGRFTQADDPSYADPLDPQTTQLYGYVSNNPMRWVDPTGHDGECAPGMSACVSAPDPLKELQRWEWEMWLWENAVRPMVLPETPLELAASVIIGPGKLTLPVRGVLTAARTAKLLVNTRTSLLSAAKNARLRDAITNLYRRGAKLGNGSSMDALRLEGSHLEKVLGRRTQLQRILREENLGASDRRIVKELLIDIQNSVSSHLAKP